MMNPIMKLAYGLLAIPVCYDMFQTAVGSVKFRRNFVSSKIELYPMKNVLDLGCGTASTISQLRPGQSYLGIDTSKEYIRKAIRRAGNTDATFFNSAVEDEKWTRQSQLKGESLGLALGIYHHIDNTKLIKTLENLNEVLEPGSKIVSLDPIIDEQTSSLASWFALKDRGKYIRTVNEYTEIFWSQGFEIDFEIKRKQFRIPYDLLLLTATKVG
jgi:trans-aconitate methyltransferase